MAALFAFAAPSSTTTTIPSMDGDVGLAMLACGLSLAGRLPRSLPALPGLGALVWAGTLAPGVVGRVSVRELFQSSGMLSATVEEAREMGGLLIVAVWMAVLALVGSRRLP